MRLRTHPLSRVVLTSSKFNYGLLGQSRQEEDFSRKGAKRCRVSKGFSLRLCAFA